MYSHHFFVVVVVALVHLFIDSIFLNNFWKLLDYNGHLYRMGCVYKKISNMNSPVIMYHK